MQDFDYEVIRRPRRKTVGICVKPDQTVQVAIPKRFPLAKVDALVRGKADWIRRKLAQYQDIQEQYKPKQYVSGETFAYLGRDYRLTVVEGAETPINVRQKTLQVGIPHDLSPEKRVLSVTKALEAWFREKAQLHLTKRTAWYTARMHVAPASVGIKSYRSRWGSCHTDGRIYFNWRIIMAPPSIVDYVVVHELCHLAHHNHSPDYWRLVESVMPEYRTARGWLKQHGHGLEL
ncbi:MAG: SprT family zinc-dependent metalloprotease [Mariprofundaceae bacterium]|nr:SprT family zinc-dependent metalloprotease [Mariprofundaceae bacterium]